MSDHPKMLKKKLQFFIFLKDGILVDLAEKNGWPFVSTLLLKWFCSCGHLKFGRNIDI